jgi:hypothetical protein
MKTFIEKGQNRRNCWVVETYEGERCLEIREFVTKAKMTRWLKEQEMKNFTVDPKMNYQMECQITRTSRNTGKEYSKWEFIGWSPVLYDLEKVEWFVKGKFLFVTTSESSYRYHIEEGVKN